MSYNLLWSDEELVVEFFRQGEQEGQVIKSYEERLNKEEALKFARRIIGVCNLRMAKIKEDNRVMPQKPIPTNDDLGVEKIL